jgi:hypothetical protein
MLCEACLASQSLAIVRRCESALEVTTATHLRVSKTLLTSRTLARQAQVGATSKAHVSLPKKEPRSVPFALNLCLQNAMRLLATSMEHEQPA